MTKRDLIHEDEKEMTSEKRPADELSTHDLYRFIYRRVSALFSLE